MQVLGLVWSGLGVFCFFLFLRQDLIYVTQAGLELEVSLLSLLSTRIAGVCQPQLPEPMSLTSCCAGSLQGSDSICAGFSCGPQSLEYPARTQNSKTVGSDWSKSSRLESSLASVPSFSETATQVMRLRLWCEQVNAPQNINSITSQKNSKKGRRRSKNHRLVQS